jgi:hypothetical protein
MKVQVTQPGKESLPAEALVEGRENGMGRESSYKTQQEPHNQLQK